MQQSQHWLYNANNRCHDPIGLEDFLGDKMETNKSIHIHLHLAEVNVFNSQAQGKEGNC